MPYKTLVGQTFHYLTVLEDVGRTENGTVLYKCQCKCRRSTIVNANSLRRFNSKSCGCWRNEQTGNKFRKHGLTRSRIYKIWSNMLDRCYRQKSTSYIRYGALGITVCKRWHRFENFYSDMKDGYEKHLTIERKNSKGNYNKLNCKWATYKEQNQNKKNIRYLVIDGERKKIVDWAKISGVRAVMIRQRVDLYGWSAKRAVFEPIKIKK